MSKAELPQRIVFVGKVNSGKSGLLSALLGEDWRRRSSPVAGFTREISVHQFGDGMVIVDTPGLGDLDPKTEELARAEVAQAHLVLHLVSAAEGPAADVVRTQEWLDNELEVPALVVLSRSDIAESSDRDQIVGQICKLLNRDDVAVVSVKNGGGVAELAAKIHEIAAAAGAELRFIRWFRVHGAELEARLEAQAEEAIHWAVGRSLAISLVPFASFAGHIANEIYMVNKIATVYGEELDEGVVKGFLTAIGATFVGLGLSALLPGFGALIAAPVTYAAGKVAHRWIKGGMADDPSKLKAEFEEARAAYKA